MGKRGRLEKTAEVIRKLSSKSFAAWSIGYVHPKAKMAVCSSQPIKLAGHDTTVTADCPQNRSGTVHV